jgi:hypothetical protein
VSTDGSSDGLVLAPVPPGRPGQTASQPDLLAYLDALRRWVVRRRAELDVLDRGALAAPDKDSYTNDITLSMALWQAVSSRNDELVKIWDSGRVGRGEREQLTRLVWGRLDAGLGAGLAVSLVEACRLSDALAGQIRARLALDPNQAGLSDRVNALRAGLERCRDQIRREINPYNPDAGRTAAARVERLSARLRDVVDSAGRGGDVTGPLATLEMDAARCERDLIVAAAKRHDDVRDRERAVKLRAELQVRGRDVRALAERCLATVSPAPRLGVPDVESLGPVPDAADAVDAYLAKLNRVDQALRYAQDKFDLALAELRELSGRLDGYRAMAVSRGAGSEREVVDAYRLARAALDARPAAMAAARPLVTAYADLVRARGGPPQTGAGSTPGGHAGSSAWTIGPTSAGGGTRP